MKIAITGKPGVGKTTACIRVFNSLRDRMKIRGFVTREIRDRGERIGFEIFDLNNEFSYLLAKKGEGYPRVGKYRVFVENLKKIAERMVERYADADLVIIDEIGPMELKSPDFVRAVERLIEVERSFLVTVHLKSTHFLAEKIRREFDLIHMDLENRNKVVREVIERFDKGGQGEDNS